MSGHSTPTPRAMQLGDPRLVEITEVNVNYKCCFCGRHEINPAEWGAMLELDDIITHHFCLLFSSAIEQNGSDYEGFLGFMPKDIIAEVRRGKKLKCKYCKKANATIGCGIAKCRDSYHYPCGYENGCVAIFEGQFQSFCPKHKTVQEIPPGTCTECPICYMDTEDEEVIWPPCCGKQVFHRRCISYTAKAAGYAFKCPLCNSTQPAFMMAMKKNGVYIPGHEAVWETEPNAYQELYTNYSHCDAKKCLCPDGRESNSKGPRKWSLVRCYACGHSATHVKCSNLKTSTWECNDCKLVEENLAKRGLDVEDGDVGADAENSGASDLDVSATSLHRPSFMKDDSSSEEEERIPNRSSSVQEQPCLTIQNDRIPEYSPEHPTETIRVCASDSTNGQSNEMEPTTPTPRSLRQGQSRTEQLLNPETGSTVYNVKTNHALGIVLVEKPGVSSGCSGEIGSQKSSELEETPTTQILSENSVAKEDTVEEGFETDAVEPSASTSKETIVDLDMSDDDVVEVEPDIVVEKVVVKPHTATTRNSFNKSLYDSSDAFSGMLRRKRGTFSPEKYTALLLPPGRRPRPWLGRSTETICLEVELDEDRPGTSSSGDRRSVVLQTESRHNSINSHVNTGKECESNEAKRKRVS